MFGFGPSPPPPWPGVKGASRGQPRLRAPPLSRPPFYTASCGQSRSESGPEAFQPDQACRAARLAAARPPSSGQGVGVGEAGAIAGGEGGRGRGGASPEVSFPREKPARLEAALLLRRSLWAGVQARGPEEEGREPRPWLGPPAQALGHHDRRGRRRPEASSAWGPPASPQGLPGPPGRRAQTAQRQRLPAVPRRLPGRPDAP